MTVTDGVWLPASPDLSLRHGDIHVWRLALNQLSCHRYQSSAPLSDSERQRAGRFHFQADRDRYVVSRNVLRNLLGRYLGQAPREVELGSTEHGKPFLLEAEGEPSIRFNLSHSGDWTVYAFASDREVGIDVERIRPLPDFETIATRVFTCTEQELIALAPRQETLATFFRLWSRKEAYVKAIGHGLSIPLHTVSVATNSIDPPNYAGRMHERRRWYVQDVPCAPSYAAALATQGRPDRVICWQYE